jgi:hypothetical protein
VFWVRFERLGWATCQPCSASLFTGANDMPESPGLPKNEERLSVRIETLRVEVQELVDKGVEHPLFEFKRELSIARESLDDRLDFIKLLQGVANSEGQDERCIVVGADPAKKMFYDVGNCSEYDHANAASILSKYLDPVPRLQIFNSLLTKDGKRFVLFVLDAVQPRPIVLKTEGARSDGKTRLRAGDIWIKRGTGLFPATRADIDLMYRERMEEEAEDRARKRLKHLAEISPSGLSLGPVRSRVPNPELFLGPGPEFRRFVEDVIAENDLSRLRMLVELAREWVVDGWDQIGARRNLQAQQLDRLAALNLILVEEFFRDKFIPSLQSLTALAMLIIKYNQEPAWLHSVADTLSDAFESARGLQALKSYDPGQEHSLPWWRPGLEIYMAAKCISAYAVHRKRHEFLPALLPRTAMRIELDGRETQQTPLLFWPLSVYTEFFPNGQAVEGRLVSSGRLESVALGDHILALLRISFPRHVDSSSYWSSTRIWAQIC